MCRKIKFFFSRSGQKLFILHMLVLPLIPITALVIQNSVNMSTLQGYQTRVSTIRRQVIIVFTGEFFSPKPGAGSNGDRAVHPEHTGGESRSCPLYLHQSGRWAIANPATLVLKGSLVDQIPGKHFPLSRHGHTSKKKIPEFSDKADVFV